MRRQRTFLRILASLIFLIPGVFGQVPPGRAAQAPPLDSKDGIIVLGGGFFEEEKSTALLKKIFSLSRSGCSSLVIIPTADSQLDLKTYEKSASAAFADLGVAHISALQTRNRSAADSDAFVAPLSAAECVWIPGGAPQLLFDVFPNTKIQAELQGVLNRGGIVAGDSAGALLIAQQWLSIDPAHPEILPAPPQRGLGLLADAFVLPHVNRYKPGVAAVGANAYVGSHPGVSGILIEEHTAVAIQRGQISRLIGDGRAGIVDGSSHGADSVVWLTGTAGYDLRRREFVH